MGGQTSKNCKDTQSNNIVVVNFKTLEELPFLQKMLMNGHMAQKDIVSFKSYYLSMVVKTDTGLYPLTGLIYKTSKSIKCATNETTITREQIVTYDNDNMQAYYNNNIYDQYGNNINFNDILFKLNLMPPIEQFTDMKSNSEYDISSYLPSSHNTILILLLIMIIGYYSGYRVVKTQ
jgi:hypothetical protein